SRVGKMQGFDYIQFIVPGLIMMAVITNSFSNVVSSFFGSKFQRSVEELLVSPTKNSVIIAGYVLGGVLRALIVGAIVLVVSLFFTDIQMHSPLLVFVFISLTAVMFSLAGFFNAMFARKFDDVTIIPTFVLTPLTYLGGVFYSISLLPAFWQSVSKLNPILYMINGFRYGFLGVSDVNVVTSFLIVLLFIAAFFTLNLYLMNKGYGLKS
ncbi:MAG: ABC transporter permease, partial [Candidatus Nanoarchaeia archaeon]